MIIYLLNQNHYLYQEHLGDFGIYMDYQCDLCKIYEDTFRGHLHKSLAYGVINKYIYASTQLSTKPEYVYKGQFYGSEGIKEGTLMNVSNFESRMIGLSVWDYYNCITLPEDASNFFNSVQLCHFMYHLHFYKYFFF